MQQISHYSRVFLSLLLMGSVAIASAPASAQVMDEPAEALVVIRFNQPRVYFDQQLYGAISKAVAVKPEVEFTVVSYAPQTGDRSADASWQALASRNTQTVVSSMQNMGVPLSRIHVSGQPMQGIRYDETHVYVQ